MKDVFLQIARRASGEVTGTYVPPPAIMEMLSSWMDHNLVLESSLVSKLARMGSRPTNACRQFTLIRTRIRRILFERVQVEILQNTKAAGVDTAFAAELKKNGLADFLVEVPLLAQRLAKVVAINASTYAPIYQKILDSQSA